MTKLDVERAVSKIDRPAEYRRPLALLAVLCGCIAIYLLPAWLGGSTAMYGLFVMIAILAVMALGVDLVLSYLGEVSLGHTIFWAIGGAAGALFSTTWHCEGWVRALGVDLVLSYLGEVSLGHTIFWAIGGYAAAILSTTWNVNGWVTATAAIA